MSPNSLQTFTKSSNLITFACFLILIALYPNPQRARSDLDNLSLISQIDRDHLDATTGYPQTSSQQVIINKLSTIQVNCKYKFDSYNIYKCELHVTVPVSTTDVLEITGTHLDNHTDADVHDVYYSVGFAGFFHGEVLQKFNNLKSIYLSGGELREFNPSAFDVCPKLERLLIFNSQLEFFPPGMLKNCENLVYFEMMSQKVETFPEDFFGNTKNLEQFVVPANRLTYLPEKLLQNMEKLKVLRIGYNKLKELSPNFLINSPNLEEVSAYVNEFQDQGDIGYALNGKINLKYLWLDDNNFTNFDFRFFTQFQKLEYLSIGNRMGPKLTDIHWQSLPASLTDLKIYDIDEEIPENAFDRVVNLRTLILYGAAIQTFHKDTFKPLTKLVFLYLYETGLKALHPELFTNQINLSNLLISSSQIEELPTGIFVPLVNIGIVNSFNGIQITSGKIRRLNADSFGQHPHLQHIDFSHNEINEIERGIFTKFHPNMRFVGFRNNECISEYLGGEDLDNNEKLETCFKNWEEIDPNNRTTTTTTTTTPGGCGKNFNGFEVTVIILVGIFKVLLNIVN